MRVSKNIKSARVLITGGYGFLGHHLCTRLKDQGWKWVGRFHSAQYDFTEKKDVMTCFKQVMPDVVVHLAAKCGGIGANMANPADFWRENLLMGVHTMEACADIGAKLIMVGTTCSYPKLAELPFDEDDIFNGYPEPTNAPYGIAKRSLLVGAQAFYKQYGLKCAYLIPTNMYGEFDNFDPQTSHVIPAMIRAFHDAKKKDIKEVVLWGDGSPTRDFMYAGDCAVAIETAMIHFAAPMPINLGTGIQTSIRSLAEMVAQIVGYKGDITWDKGKPNGQPLRALKTELARQVLGWSAQTKLYEGIQKTYAWYLSSQG